MSFLLWLENNPFSDWVRNTGWVYPWVISFHSIGMGFLVGVIFMISLRALGFGRFSIAPLERFLLVVRIAFVVNFATGLTMFVIEAQQFFFSPTFRIKMLLIVLGAISGWLLAARAFASDTGWSQSEAGSAPQAVKVIAAASLLCWVGAIFAGRLTAYLP